MTRRDQPRVTRGPDRGCPGARSVADERGHALIVLLGVLTVVTLMGVSFINLMNVRLRLAGQRHRALAARYLAEAGVERALWALETDPESARSLVGFSERLDDGRAQGKFTIESLHDDPSGHIALRSWGEVAGIRRGVQATTRLAPRVLTHALFGNRLVRLEGQESRTYLVPAQPSSDCVYGGHLGSNGEIWVVNPGVAVNAFTGAPLATRVGAQRDHDLLAPETRARLSARDGALGKTILAGSAVLTFGADHQPADQGWLWVHGVRFNMHAVSAPEGEPLPVIDHATLQRLAEENLSNAAINEAVGRRQWTALRHKRDSVYDREEFLHVLAYLASNPSETLSGPIYVKGPVVVASGASIHVRDGFLAIEGSLTVEARGRVEVRHARGFHTLPGIITIGDDAPIVVQQGAVLVVDGLVYAQRLLDAGEGSLIDIRGALVGADPYVSIRNHNATIVVRYDPSVLSSVGVRPAIGSRKVVGRVVSLEDVR